MSENSQYEINWLGYNEKPNYDRIWGWLRMSDDREFTFWGVKGKKISFKLQGEWWSASRLVHENISRGYRQIALAHYEMICPGFTEELEIWLTGAILSDGF